MSRYIILLSILAALVPQTGIGAGFDKGLVGYWKLQGDCRDYSGMGNHGINRGAMLTARGSDGSVSGAAEFDGRNSYIEVPDSESLRLGTGDFSISVWVKCDDGAANAGGDILNKYNSALRKGINLCISSSSPGYSSTSDVRNVHFGIDNAVDGSWTDCGRPSPTNTLVSILIVYNGRLYAGIADARDPRDACRVFRYEGGTRWTDCGRAGSDLKTLSIMSAVVHNGELYVGTGVWDWEKAWAGNAGPTHVYRYEGGTKWHDCGRFGTGFRVMSLASLNGSLYASDDTGSSYRYDGDDNWVSAGRVDAQRLYSMMAYRGDLYGGANISIHRLDGGMTWATVGDRLEEGFGINQVHTLEVYGGNLYAGTWPEGRILRYDGDKNWSDCGSTGISTDEYKINEVNDLVVYNGKLYAGVIPKAEIWRYDGGRAWSLVKQLVANPDWTAENLPSWNRVPCMAVFQGRLYAGTSTCHGRAESNPKTDAGKVFSWEAGRCASYDDDLGAGWRHVAAAREKNRLKLYIDGKLVSTSSHFNPVDYDISNDKPLKIGFGPRDFFKGCMTELRIYNRALTEADVRSLSQKTTRSGRTVPVTPEEEARWLRWVIPLPKRISIKSKVELAASEVKVRLCGSPGDLEKNAAAKLTELLGDCASHDKTKFEILLGVCDADGKVGDVTVPGAAELAKLPNRDQAYCIAPAGRNKLLIAALHDKGVFYGAMTLRSLLEATAAGGKVTLPMVMVVDWPDIAERGRWGGTFNGLIINDVNNDVEWMASLKMNLIESHVSFRITEDSSAVAEVDANDLRLAHLNAVKYVPIIPHLDLLGSFAGMYDAYPAIRGKGEAAQQGEDRIAPCISSPELVQVLADWMMKLAANRGVTDICCWLSEHPVRCECADCTRVGQYVGEAEAFIKSWRIARQKYPDLGLRILLSQGTYETNDRILAVVPEDVGVTYYHGGLTYDSSRDVMIYPLMEDYAGKGRWLGCYPQISAAWRIICPWSGAQFVKYRADEFVDKKLKCVAWYAPANGRLYDFNITAAAEWCWNAQGRDEHEFTAAWATRKGFRDPDAVADWAAVLGPVSWNLYGSRVPYWFCWDKVQNMLRDGQCPALGQDMFRYWKAIEDFDKDVASCERALEIAKRQDSQLLVDETVVVQGYIKMMKEMYLLLKQLAAPQPPSGAERTEMIGSMERLAKACLDTTTALRSWVKPIGTGPGIGEGRFNDTVMFTEKAVIAISDALAAQGIENNVRAYLSGESAAWVTSDRDETMNKSAE